MGAAYRFDPQRIGPERWATYAWMTLEHTRWRGVDHSGVIRSRSPRATTVTLGDTEPVGREPGPTAVATAPDPSVVDTGWGRCGGLRIIAGC